MSSRSHLHSGQAAEAQACAYLQAQGLSVAAKNFRGPQGEIDLIMRDGEIYVFVEVRLRKHSDYGAGIETISSSKQHRIIKTSLYFLQQANLLERVDARFDVLGIDKEQNFTWIKNAFEVQY